MHDRAVTAKAANDSKARNEPSDIEMDLSTSLKMTKLFEQHNILPNLKDLSLSFQP